MPSSGSFPCQQLTNSTASQLHNSLLIFMRSGGTYFCMNTPLAHKSKLKTGNTPLNHRCALDFRERGTRSCCHYILTQPAHHDKIQRGDTAKPTGGTTPGGFLPTTQLDKHLSFHVSESNPAKNSQSNILTPGKHFEIMFKINYRTTTTVELPASN